MLKKHNHKDLDKIRTEIIRQLKQKNSNITLKE